MILYKAHLTPTLLLFSPGHQEESNHMLRMHPEYQFNFLRVSFTATSQNMGWFNNEPAGSSLIKYYKKVLSEGIKLGNRRLKFMGQSGSQQKSRSHWFLIENDPITMANGQKMIQKLGSFGEISNLMLKNSRQGQLFSTCKYICQLEPHELSILKDIKRNGRCFTDGVGKCSPEIACLIAQKFGHIYASAF